MKIPAAIWWIAIPTLIGAIVPVIAQFYPVNVYFWSALVVAIGGAIVSAIAAYRQVSAQPQPPAPPPADTGTPGVAAQAAPMATAPRRSFARTWLLGN